MVTTIDPYEYPELGMDDRDVADILAEDARRETIEAEAYEADDRREYMKEAILRLSAQDAEAGDIPPSQVAIQVLEVLPARGKHGALLVRYRAVDFSERKVAYCSYDYPATREEPGDAGEYLDWEGAG